MPFPFVPGGVLLALSVLGAAYLAFAAALKALAWTVDAARGSMLNGVVSGLRRWEPSSAGPGRRPGSDPKFAGSLPAGMGPTSEDLAMPEIEALERVSPTSVDRRR